jgi:integrase
VSSKRLYSFNTDHEAVPKLTKKLSAEERFLFFDILDAIQVLHYLHSLEEGIYALKECSSITAKFVKNLNGIPKFLGDELDAIFNVLEIVSIELEGCELPKWNPVRGQYEKHPLFALLCTKPHKALHASHENIIKIITFFLFLSSLKRLVDSQNFYKHNCRELRHYLKREKLPGNGNIYKSRNFDDLHKVFSSIQSYVFPTIQNSLPQILFSAARNKFFSNALDDVDDVDDKKAVKDYGSSSDLKTSHVTSFSRENTHSSPIANIKTRSRYIQTQDEDEPAFIECVDIDVGDEVPKSSNLNEQSVRYGTRLDVMQKLSLQLCSHILTETEWSTVRDYLIKSLDGDLEESVVSVLLLFTSITSKQLSYILTLEIGFDDLGQKEGIDLNRGVWRRADVRMPNAYSADETCKQLLKNHHPFLDLPLPELITDTLKKLDFSTGNRSYGSWIKNLPELFKSYLQKMNVANPALKRWISIASIRSVMFNRLLLRESVGIAGLTLANTEYFNPTHLYYLAAAQEILQVKFNSSIVSLGFETSLRPCVEYKNRYCGSQLLLDEQQLKILIAAKYSELLHVQSYDNLLMDELIAHHNRFVNYTIMLILICTGYRPRKEYAVEFLNLDLENGLIMIADKLNFIDSAVRFVPLATAIQTQIRSYLAHLRLLARHLSRYNSELASVVSANSHIDSKVGYSLFGIIENERWFPVGASHVFEYLNELGALPHNVFRHFFCQKLSVVGAGNVAFQMMGHTGNAEAPIDSYSLSTLSEIARLKHYTDKIADMLEIKTVELSFKKGKQYSPTRKLLQDSPYQPKYFSEYQARDVDAKRLASACLRKSFDLNKTANGELDFATFAQQCTDLALDEINTLRLRAKTSDVMFHVNKVLHRASHYIGDRVQSLTYVAPYLNRAIDLNMLYTSRVIEQFRKNASKYLIDIVISSLPQDLVGPLIVISALVHNQAAYISKQSPNGRLELTLESKGGLFNLKWRQGGETQTVVLDSVTALIAYQYLSPGKKYLFENPNKKCKKIFSELCRIYGKGILDILALDSAHKDSFKKVSRLLQDNMSIHTSGLVMGYRAQHFQTTNLESTSLSRLLSGVVEGGDEKTEDITLSMPRSTNSKYAVNEDKQTQNKLMDDLSILLKRFEGKSAGNSFRSAVLAIWRENIGAPEQSTKSLLRYSDKLSDLTIAGLIYIIDLTQRKGKGRENMAMSSVKTYMSKILSPLLELYSDCAFLSLDEDEFHEVYKSVLSYRKTQDRAEGAKRLRDFHRVLEKNFGVEHVNWYEIEPNINHINKNVNANLLTPTEYNNAYRVITHNDAEISYDQRCSAIILMLSHRAGLRIGEICSLKVNDIDMTEWMLHVRSNNLRRLKTILSNRRFPLFLFLSYEEKSLIMEQVSIVRRLHPDAVNPPLFADPADSTTKLNTANHSRYVMALMREVTQDNTLRNHHGRHGFASYLLAILCNVHQSGVLKEHLHQWCREDDIQAFIDEVNRVTAGQSYEISIRPLYQISQLLGHASPKTTMKYYMHFMDIVAVAESERWIDSYVNISSLAKLGNFSAIQVRKWKQRYKGRSAVGVEVLRRLCLRDGLFIEALPNMCVRQLPTFESIASDQYAMMSNFIEVEGLMRDIFARYPQLDAAKVKNVSDSTSDRIISILQRISEAQIENIRGDIDWSLSVESRVRQARSFIHTSFFKSVLTKWISLKSGNAEAFETFVSTMTEAMRFDEFVVPKSSQSNIALVCSKLALNARYSSISRVKKKWMQLTEPCKVDFYKDESSERSWNNKVAHILVIENIAQIPNCS